MRCRKRSPAPPHRWPSSSRRSASMAEPTRHFSGDSLPMAPETGEWSSTHTRSARSSRHEARKPQGPAAWSASMAQPTRHFSGDSFPLAPETGGGLRRTCAPSRVFIMQITSEFELGTCNRATPASRYPAASPSPRTPPSLRPWRRGRGRLGAISTSGVGKARLQGLTSDRPAGRPVSL